MPEVRENAERRAELPAEILRPMRAAGGFCRNRMERGQEAWICKRGKEGRRKEKIIPCREWIEGIVEQCDRAGVPVFMKESLLPIVGEGGLRRDFPEGLRNLRISPKMENRLFDACAKCKRRMKKSDMLTLFARSRRGERPKQFGFMCESCFKEFCQGLDLNVPEFEGIKKEALPSEGEGNG